MSTSRLAPILALLVLSSARPLAAEPPDGTVLVDVRIPFGPGGSFPPAYAGAILPSEDGRLLIGAAVTQADPPFDDRPAVARLTEVGDLDPTFGTEGVLFDLASGLVGDLEIAALAIDPESGRILVAGTDSNGPSGPRGVVVRLESDGSLDETFSSDGVQIVDVAPGTVESHVADVRVDDSGRTLLAGWTRNPITLESDFLVVRLDGLGELDPSFSGDGIATPSHGDVDLARGIAPLPGGQILVAGSTDPSTIGANFAVLRLLESGAPDPAFGVGGWAIAPFALELFGSEWARGLEIDSRGRLLVYGFACAGGPPIPCFTTTWAATRFLPTGTLDLSFSGDGFAHGPVGSFEGLIVVEAGSRAAGDRLVVGGWWSNSLSEALDFGFARLSEEGALDPDFGGDGYVSVDPGEPESDLTAVISAMAIAADGRPVAVGVVEGTSVHFLRLASGAIFVDGFDSGAPAAWSASTP